MTEKVAVLTEAIEIYTDRDAAKARVAVLGMDWYAAHGLAGVCVTIRPDDGLDCIETQMAAKMGIDTTQCAIYCVYPNR